MAMVNGTVLTGVLLLLGVWSAIASNRVNYEKQLREDLFLKQPQVDTNLRPVEYFKDKLTVSLGLSITHITEVNTREGFILINGWVQMSWFNHLLKWNKDDYGGITNIRIPSALVWKPDITLYNHASSESMANFGPTLAILYDNGLILWVPPTTLKASCEFHDIRAFPFDKHSCFFKFGSWTYDGFMVDLEMYSNNTQDIIEHLDTNQHEWQIKDVSLNRNEKYYTCCAEPYPDITINLKIQRSSPYYVATVLLPAILVMFFILISFWLPPTNEEKLVLCVFNLLYLGVLLAHMQFVLQGGHFLLPGIVLFCGKSLIFATLSFILSIITFNMSVQPHLTSPPDCIIKLFGGRFGWLLCLPQNKDNIETNLLTSQQEAHDNMEIPDGEMERSPAEDWVIVATGLDRCFFYFYCLVFIIVLAYCFSPKDS